MEKIKIGDNMAKNNTKNLPGFGYLDELVEFFDTHDLGEYWNETTESHFEVDIKKKNHFFALDAELANKLTEISKLRQISSNALIDYLVERENSGIYKYS